MLHSDFWASVHRSRHTLQDEHIRSVLASPGNLDLIDETRQHLSQDVEAVTELLRGLKSRQNSLSPPCRLPLEILEQIFSLNKSFVHAGSTNALVPLDDDYPEPPTLIAITHVCRHWRQVSCSIQCDTWNISLIELYIRLRSAALSSGMILTAPS